MTNIRFFQRSCFGACSVLEPTELLRVGTCDSSSFWLSKLRGTSVPARRIRHLWNMYQPPSALLSAGASRLSQVTMAGSSFPTDFGDFWSLVFQTGG